MEIKILESSPKAQEMAREAKQKGKKATYPFDDLNVGMSFTIELATANVKSLRAIASRKGKDSNKSFVVVEHKDMQPACVEVARIE